MKKKRKKPNKSSPTSEWNEKLLEKVKLVHKKKCDEVVSRILKRISSSRYGIISRSKKKNVECNITLDDLREKIYNSYGTPCKYCGRILTVKNFVFDHIHPISKQGTSNSDNIQVICKTSNSMKGSLDEEHFKLLLSWLDTAPPELKRDISIRLARGIN